MFDSDKSECAVCHMAGRTWVASSGIRLAEGVCVRLHVNTLFVLLFSSVPAHVLFTRSFKPAHMHINIDEHIYLLLNKSNKGNLCASVLV